jgi:SAM-dependent methyltransferase
MKGDTISIKIMQCPSCKNKEEIKFLEKIKKYKIYHCLNCDLFFSYSDTLPNRKWYEEALADKTAMVLPEVWLKWQKGIYNQFLKRKCFCESLLDVGCGDGEFLKKAQEVGYKVTGIDLNRILISKIKEKYNLEVYPMNFEEFTREFPQRTFDIITFFEVLEHMNNLDKFFNLIKSKLKTNGYIALSVPNRNRFRFGLKRFPEWDSPPHHFTWWNVNSLKKLLTIKGFKILEFIKFKKVLKLRIEQRDKNNKNSIFLRQLSLYEKFKYLFYKKMVASFLFKVTHNKLIEVKINVEGPYLYALAQLKK